MCFDPFTKRFGSKSCTWSHHDDAVICMFSRFDDEMIFTQFHFYELTIKSANLI